MHFRSTDSVTFTPESEKRDISFFTQMKKKQKKLIVTVDNNGKKKKLQISMPTWRVYSFDKGYNFFLKFKFINLLVQEKKISLISYVFLIKGYFF